MPRRDDIEGEPAPPPNRNSIPWLFHDPGVRTYVVAGLGALAMVFFVLFGEGGPLGGTLILLIGVAGLILRWTPAPPLLLLVLAWFLLFPIGIPDAYERPWGIDDDHFRVIDLMLVAAVVVYLACQYRVFGLAVLSIPPDTTQPRKEDRKTRRPPELIPPTEFARLLYLVGGVVVVGQLVWLVATKVEVDAGEFIPFRWASGSRSGYSYTRRTVPPGSLGPGTTRFLAITGLLVFTALLLRLVFGYWRLRAMGPDEARLVIQDTGWNETRREPDRIEKWRAAARERAEARAAARPRPEGETR